jgi:ABC-type amino acid transport substrate-binding protein
MNKRFLLFLLTALLLLVGTALTACGDDDDDDGGGGGTDSSEIDTLKPGTLLVGVDVPYPPFEQGRPPDYEGFEIDLMNEIANRLGLETEYKDTPFDTIFRDLSQDKFDVAIAGSTITPEREKVVDFGNPWFLTEQSLLVQEGSDIQTIDDLEGKTVGVQKGTTGEAYINDNGNADDVRSYPEIDTAFRWTPSCSISPGPRRPPAPWRASEWPSPTTPASSWRRPTRRTTKPSARPPTRPSKR